MKRHVLEMPAPHLHSVHPGCTHQGVCPPRGLDSRDGTTCHPRGVRTGRWPELNAEPIGMVTTAEMHSGSWGLHEAPTRRAYDTDGCAGASPGPQGCRMTCSYPEIVEHTQGRKERHLSSLGLIHPALALLNTEIIYNPMD